MRMTAPAIGGAAIALAVALAWFFRPQPEPSVVLDDSAAPAAPRAEPRGATNAAPSAAPSTEPVASAPPTPERSPLPGETPATPMTQLLADRQQNMLVRDTPGESGIPPQLAEGEREFAAEPIDATWAPGAEAKLLAVFAEIPGLELIDLQVECRSTMCRLQLTQPPAEPGQGGLPFSILRDEVGMTPRWMMAVVAGGAGGAPTGPLPMRSIAYLWREGFAPKNEVGAPQ
jgi:hypothetical protein